MNPNELKLLVKDKYGSIAHQSLGQNQASCCGATSCCSTVDYAVFSEDYKNLNGYQPDADLGLGCGLPTAFADIHEGDAVLDLGCGAGNDCFVARSIVGESGSVTGLDFTETMLIKARKNLEKSGYTNMDFVLGDIESMPLKDAQFDVVVSNCVLNLVPNKEKAFSEIRRVLKPGGHFCVSDVVLNGELPDAIRKSVEMYAGCVSGAIKLDDYLALISNQGFVNIVLHKQKAIELPEEVLLDVFSPEELQTVTNSQSGIFSITVSATKE